MADGSSLFAEAQALYEAGHLPQAREFCREVLQASPHHGGALYLLGLIAFRGRGAGEAAHWFSEAATVALAQGDADAALRSAVNAVSSEETPQTRRLFADIASAMRFAQDDPVLHALMTRAIAEEWGPLAPLVRAAVPLVRLTGGALQEDVLLRAMLAAAPIPEAALEEALTAARRDLLMPGGDAAFAAALAQQCFLNGYVFGQDENETVSAQALRRGAAGLPDAELAVLACYVPLHAIAGIETRTSGNKAMTALLRRQRDEPAEEARLAAALPALTPVIGTHDSAAPWPRWADTVAADTPMTLRDHLAARFPRADLARVPERPAMLAAGCGTGQYALHLARALVLDGVTAIDLDRTALAFAARKARAAGLNIIFGQGDILQAASLNRTFGLIECGGVLHQLPDPLAGWKALLPALDQGGVMRVAVHSAAAQQAFAPVRARIAAQGFAPTREGIRDARRWLKGLKDESLRHILEAPVFFSDGGCRHLLFGAEYPLALPQIAAFLAAHGLVPIGLDVPAEARAAYRARFPDDPAAADLDNWAAFEQENPQTFAAMIQLWVHRRG